MQQEITKDIADQTKYRSVSNDTRLTLEQPSSSGSSSDIHGLLDTYNNNDTTRTQLVSATKELIPKLPDFVFKSPDIFLGEY